MLHLVGRVDWYQARGHEAVKYFRVPIQDGLTAKNNIKETFSYIVVQVY